MIPAAVAGRIQGASSIPTCAAAGPFWPTMTLAVSGGSAWVACKDQARIVRIDLASGRQTATLRLGRPVIAVTAGLGSLWALDSGSTLYRIDHVPRNPGRLRVTKRIAIGATAAYNIWVGADAVWVADDQAGRVLRISPATNRVVARIPVGDGPADMVFSGQRGWVLTHRDNGLYRIDTVSNIATRLATVGGGNAATERVALLGGSLWLTGRGVGLLQADPETGAIRRTIDLDGTGIDIVASGGALWIPVRTLAVDGTGFPTMTALRRVLTSGVVTTPAQAVGRVDVHGLVAAKGALWIADNTQGALYRIHG